MTIFRYFLPLIIFLFITGCSGVVKLNYKPGQIPDTAKVSKPLTILLKPYVDSRGGEPRYDTGGYNDGYASIGTDWAF